MEQYRVDVVQKNKNFKQPRQVIATDPYSRRLLELAKRVATTNAYVLISGESGVGKEVIARYIHDNSERASQPFIAINCAAIPDNMLEASLFGYEKGAFTGAVKAHSGKFEQAQHGSLLLDEISEMSIPLQAKLLRVLQEKEVERLGGEKVIDLDVRIIATTNRNLQDEIAKGNFRTDLYYRLNIFPIHWVPLRKRLLDIVPLAEYLLSYHTKLAGRKMPVLSEDAKQCLLQYEWLGNAREMDNVIQRVLILQTNDVLNAGDFQLGQSLAEEDSAMSSDEEDSATSSNEENTGAMGKGLKEQEHNLILNTLHKTNGNRKMAAELLSISSRTLRYKLARMREKGLAVPAASRSTKLSAVTKE